MPSTQGPPVFPKFFGPGIVESPTPDAADPSPNEKFAHAAIPLGSVTGSTNLGSPVTLPGKGSQNSLLLLQGASSSFLCIRL